MQAPYIPAQDGEFQNWITNFAALLTAAPTDYGLTAPDALTVQTAADAWDAAYGLATNPATRTSPTIAAKDAARASGTSTVRPFAIAIRNNSAVSDELKTGIGVNLPNTSRTPIPAPLTAPAFSLASAAPGVHTLAYRDATTPFTKAKPFGAIGVELYRATGTTPATDPSTATYLGTYTKSPLGADTTSETVGQVATYFGRWITRSGPAGFAQRGPWSVPLAVIVI